MKLTIRELEIIGHSLGINVYHAKHSKKRRDKQLPFEFYRNYFQAGEGHVDYSVLLDLRNKELMVSYIRSGLEFFYVTNKGIKLFREEFPLYVNY